MTASLGVLPNGLSVHVRTQQDGDTDRLYLMLHRMPAGVLPSRVLPVVPPDLDGLQRLRAIDPPSHGALVATIVDKPDEPIVGMARFDRVGVADDEAEFVVVVDPAHRGLGIATVLLGELATLAARRGINRLTGHVPSEDSTVA